MRALTIVAILALLAAGWIWMSNREKASWENTQIAKAKAGEDSSSPKEASSSNVEAIAEEAYIFGYPLVLMETTKDVMTHTDKVTQLKAPINQFVNVRTFPDPSFTDVVTPNADTLYSSAWIDLSQEPIIVSVPALGERYYLLELLDAWTNVFSTIGTRQTGNEAGNYALTGPNWKGELPSGIKQVSSPTNLIWLLGRTLTNGPQDYAAVHKIQDQYKLTPLSQWGKDFTPPQSVPLKPGVNTTSAPSAQVASMDGTTFFQRLDTAMRENPPAPADQPILNKLAQLQGADPAAINRGLERARQKISAEINEHKLGKQVNGWQITIDKMGNYGTDYLMRAAVATFGLGANLPQDAIYPFTHVDAQGNKLNGNNNYVIHFDKGKFPPAKAFWSISLYNDKQFFTANKLNRYAIGNRNNLKMNPDGSLDIYIQHDSPGAEKEANWLPAPREPFNLVLRLYSPEKSVIDGSWVPPAVEKVK